MNANINIREAVVTDGKAIQAIYAPYVEQTAVTFEYNVPSEEEFRRRIETVKQKYPWIVAEADGKIVGYAYASAFKPRDAYQWAVETSIYVDGSMKRCGIGRQLHEVLEQRLKAQGILNMNACISFIETEDEYLTQDSVRFHEQLGYKKVAHFHLCGKKFGRWYDMIWMEKMIGEHMNKVRITAIRQTVYEDLMVKYENPIEHTCDVREGQQWISVDGQQPEGMCPSAWYSMREFVESLARGEGNFYDGWMKNPMSAMISCNDGFRPFSFYIEVI